MMTSCHRIGLRMSSAILGGVGEVGSFGNCCCGMGIGWMSGGNSAKPSLLVYCFSGFNPISDRDCGEAGVLGSKGVCMIAKGGEVRSEVGVGKGSVHGRLLGLSLVKRRFLTEESALFNMQSTR